MRGVRELLWTRYVEPVQLVKVKAVGAGSAPAVRRMWRLEESAWKVPSYTPL